MVPARRGHGAAPGLDWRLRRAMSVIPADPPAPTRRDQPEAGL